MGLIVRNTTYDDNDNDDFYVDDTVMVVDTKEVGTIVFKIGNLLQVELENHEVKSYCRDELEKVTQNT